MKILKKFNSMNCIYFNLNPIETDGKPGKLIDIDLKKIVNILGIPFQYTKSFYINDLNSIESRGKHSNDNAKEILICLNGSFDIKLIYNKNEENLHIEKNEAIFIDKNIWIDFYNFKNCIILVFVDIDHHPDKNSCYNFEEYQKKFN